MQSIKRTKHFFLWSHHLWHFGVGQYGRWIKYEPRMGWGLCKAHLTFLYAHFWDVSSGVPTVWNSWDSAGKNVVSRQCECICVFSDDYSLKILSHRKSTSAFFPRCVCASVHLNSPFCWISYHKGGNGTVSPQCACVCGPPHRVLRSSLCCRCDTQKVECDCAPC